ncbi:hypothetical protein F2Q69_00044694 [Brassica cretica]|uniref:Uncharacterized protein n=1 Tax=Brassica cretica TaxID=69181 RepID=A0A8S9NGJ5_BRACR|nr:hypothetical protein F2Q69_00044694 [Brassica cretica]
MALEWVVLGYAEAAEAVMVILLMMPGLDVRYSTSVTPSPLVDHEVPGNASPLLFYLIIYCVTNLVVGMDRAA